MKKLKHLGLLAVTALMSSSVFAAIDVTAATTALSTDGAAAITAVGTALVGWRVLPLCSSGLKVRCSADNPACLLAEGDPFRHFSEWDAFMNMDYGLLYAVVVILAILMMRP